MIRQFFQRMTRRSLLGIPLGFYLLVAAVIGVAAAILFIFSAIFQGSIFAPDVTLNLALTNDDNDPANTVLINTGLDPSDQLDTLGPGPTWPTFAYDFATCTAVIVGPDLTVDMSNAYEGYFCSVLVRFDNNSTQTMDLLDIQINGAGTAPVSIVQQEACGVVSVAPAGTATVKFSMAVDPAPPVGPWAGEVIDFRWAVQGTYDPITCS